MNIYEQDHADQLRRDMLMDADARDDRDAEDIADLLVRMQPADFQALANGLVWENKNLQWFIEVFRSGATKEQMMRVMGEVL